MYIEEARRLREEQQAEADPNNSKESNALDAPYQEALEKKRRLENPSIPIIVVSIDSRIIQIGSKDPILTYPGQV